MEKGEAILILGIVAICGLIGLLIFLSSRPSTLTIIDSSGKPIYTLRES